MHTNLRFNPAEFASHARTLGLSLAQPVWLNSVGSTNAELATRLHTQPQEWPDFRVLGTDYQTAGQGRLDRIWNVPPQAGLTFSSAFRLPASTRSSDYGWVPLLTGWAVAQAVKKCGVQAHVKWPNDVLVAGKKLSGILCRVEPLGEGTNAVVIGIGINVAMPAEQLPVDTATSLLIEGAHVSREYLLAQILHVLSRQLPAMFAHPSPGHSEQATAIAAGMETLGRTVQAHLPSGEIITGSARELNEHGDLVIDSAGVTTVVSAGDVIHLRPHQDGEGES